MPVGFILQPTTRVENGRPVVMLYGKLEKGGSFLVRDTRERPRFWVREADADAAGALGAQIVADARQRRGMRGEPVACVELPLPSDVVPLRDRLQDAGIATYEADVRFAYRYLIDRSIRGALEIRGPSRPDEGVDAVFDDPEVAPADYAPALSVLSFDIETDPQAKRLFAIALYGCGAAEVLLRTPPGADCPEGAVPFPDERSLIEAFVRRVRELDPDVLTGWNVIDFDLAVLQRLAEQLHLALPLGRGLEPLRIRRPSFPGGPSYASVPGRVVADGIQLVRDAFVRLESYSLHSAAMEILGHGKILSGPDRAEEIQRLFEEDRARLVEYNLNDARLVLEILERLRLVDLAVERSRLTGMPIDRIGASVAAFDFVYLSELTRRGIVAPTARESAPFDAPITGGHVLEPRPGLYRNVLVFDFKSLYPSIIRTFQIDPLGYLPEPASGEEPIVAPNGAAFRREPGILPRLLDDLFARRQAARGAGNKVASHAIKILMNSFFGVLGTPACRFSDPAVANAITGFGREILLWSKARVESKGREVHYGDTDSLFVHAGVDDPTEARDLGARLCADLNRDLAAEVRRTWGVESRLELEFEKLFLRLTLPALRHGTAGARKRYAGLVDGPGGPQVEFTGMEAVRSDWTDLARRVQRDLYERLFADRPVDDYLREVVSDLRAGRHDDLLVYRKALRKEVDAYTAATPPHVAAARKMKGPPGRVVAYVVTREGPEPAAERSAPIDHEHYVQKQVRPVAEPVLALLGLEFDRVIGDDTQLRLL
jgi:DNA polymerase-2